MKVISLVFAAVLVAAAVPATAQVSININVPGLVEVAPPAPRYERMPGPRPDQVWVPGHWRWTGRDYAWRGGYWQKARPYYAYAPGEWVRADGGWRWRDGSWQQAKNKKHRDDNDYHKDKDKGDGYHCPPGQAKKGRC